MEGRGGREGRERKGESGGEGEWETERRERRREGKPNRTTDKQAFTGSSGQSFPPIFNSLVHNFPRVLIIFTFQRNLT